MPPATSFTKDQWPHEVACGFEFYYLSGRSDLDVPVESDVVKFFQSQAPEVLSFAPAPMSQRPLSVRFRTQALAPPVDAAQSAVAALLWFVPPDAAHGKLLFTDMHDGMVGELKLEGTLRAAA